MREPSDYCGWARIGPKQRYGASSKNLKEHRDLILNWFEARGMLALGAVEGLNTRCKLTLRKAFGFKTVENVELQLYHVLGHLPEPPITHRFC